MLNGKATPSDIKTSVNYCFNVFSFTGTNTTGGKTFTVNNNATPIMAISHSIDTSGTPVMWAYVIRPATSYMGLYPGSGSMYKNKVTWNDHSVHFAAAGAFDMREYSMCVLILSTFS